MGCRHEWSSEYEMILNIYVEAPWTWDELMHEGAVCNAMIKATGKPCATVVVVTHMGGLPKGNALTYLMEIDRQMPDNVFASAIVGAPYMVNVFMDILTSIRPHAKRVALFTRTIDEAHEKIWARYQKMSPPTGTGS